MPTTTDLYLEARLDWLIEQTQLRQPRADRRLNAIENMLTQLARQCRRAEPIDPKRELAMSAVTAGQILAWVLAEEDPTDAVMSRLLPYASGELHDHDVPDGWVRLRLP